MNITYLHSICKKARKEAAQSFYLKIMNPLWELDDSIIEIEIQDMKQTIGQSVYKKMLNEFDLTVPQLKVMEQITNSYIDVAVNRGRKFAESLVKPPNQS